MAYIEKAEISAALEKTPWLREFLYNRGFLITNEKFTLQDGYPFYGNWREIQLSNGYVILAHKNTTVYTHQEDGTSYFLIGHAYDPFHMITDENTSLKRMAKAGRDGYWDELSNLTGVFCVGYVNEKETVYSTDCAGMQLVYHGVIEGKLYIASHSKMVADLKNLRQPKYIQKLVSNRFWHYWGTWLPGDLSPFAELKRMVPNHAARFNGRDVSVFRFYPTERIVETTTEAEYQNTIHELGRIMSNTMQCIAQKWPDKKVSISVTGGKDSLTTLSCSNKVYDKLHYFSYISNVDESVDAYAARDILKHLGLEHELFQIPDEWDGYRDLAAFKLVMECNNGCIGENNANDLKKRLYFAKNPPCDVEVKSWVNELGRGWYYNKYEKKSFPKYPYAAYWRAMHKVYVTPYLIRETDRVFAEYLAKYYDKQCFDNLSWLELYFWEFAWSGGEGVFLTTEHRVSYDITIPFNNRKYVALMFSVPLEKRKVDSIPDDLIAYKEPRIVETGITVHDISHTSLRAKIVRTYLEVFKNIRFGGKKENYE